MKNDDQLKECDECGSEYYASTSKMDQLCPECASILYGYDNCDHVFGEDKRCSRCYWDGSASEYIKQLKLQGEWKRGHCEQGRRSVL